MVMRDWNAKVGLQENNHNCMEKFPLTETNENGEKMLAFMQENKLKVGASYFKKKINIK